MGEPALPPAVEQFVLECIPSVVHLEALVLLRSRPNEELAVAEIAHALYVDASRVAQALSELVAFRLVSASSPQGPFRFAPAADRREAVELLAQTHRTRLIPLSRFIHEKAAARGIRDFANAFRLRKGD